MQSNRIHKKNKRISSISKSFRGNWENFRANSSRWKNSQILKVNPSLRSEAIVIRDTMRGTVLVKFARGWACALRLFYAWRSRPRDRNSRRLRATNVYATRNEIDSAASMSQIDLFSRIDPPQDIVPRPRFIDHFHRVSHRFCVHEGLLLRDRSTLDRWSLAPYELPYRYLQFVTYTHANVSRETDFEQKVSYRIIFPLQFFFRAYLFSREIVLTMIDTNLFLKREVFSLDKILLIRKLILNRNNRDLRWLSITTL